MSGLNINRRRFLGKLPLAVLGGAILSSHFSFAFKNRVDSPFPGFDSNTRDSNDLRASGFLGNTIKVTGNIYGKDGLSLKPNARLEVWHLSPGSSQYNHRGAFSSNTDGAYVFKTEMPNRTKGKLPRIFFKVSHEGNVAFTELVLNAQKAFITHEHWENHKSLNDKLFPVYEENSEEIAIHFNITV